MTAYSEATAGLEKSFSIFTAEELSQIDLGKVPKHVAIIMDGNRRWAKQRGLPPVMGHWEGAEVLIEIVRAASSLGVETLTVFSFSTENWNRPSTEVSALMNIFELYLVNQRETMVQDGIRLDAIGDISRLPKAVQDAFYGTKKATEECKKINLVLAMNYGSRDEIRRAVVKILEENEKKKFALEEITEALIARHLDTASWGDPDLLIRTSGELRVSNFLLWQISYSEMFVTDSLWPDFSKTDLLRAILSFQKRHRRGGQ